MEQFYRRVVSGRQKGVAAALIRAISGLIEPIYRAVVSSRNASYNSGMLRTARAQCPVISVGNITTGGTGKTPVVRWLAEQLRARDRTVAVLLRGYKSYHGSSDEESLLRQLLNSAPSARPVIVHANPVRAKGAEEVLREHPKTDVFILDDGFQHRRLDRDFDLVLVDATNPFGHDHVLPRGLLREPLDGLSRASAILLTRVSQALPEEVPAIEHILRQNAPHVPIYHSNHTHRRLVGANEASPSHDMEFLRGKNIVAFAGIGNPEALERQLTSAGANVVATRWFGDHYHYSTRDVTDLQSLAHTNQADLMVTTEKDWVKLGPIASTSAKKGDVAMFRVEMVIEFAPNDEQKLLKQILARI